MSDWKVKLVEWDAPELERMLLIGWEPFGVISHEGVTHYALRHEVSPKDRNARLARIMQEAMQEAEFE